MVNLTPICSVLLLALAACSTVPGDPAQAPAAYRTAISDAAVASPGKVVALLPAPQGEWVSVVSWMSEKNVPSCSRDALPCAVTIGERALWVTLSGEVRDRCRSWNLRGDALRRRLEQLLGLPQDPPPQYRMATFVEFRVARESLARPCLGVDQSDSAGPRCTLTAQPATPTALRNFVGEQMAASYVVDGPQGPGYPYTRLGYTYDWAPSARSDHYGASEFVVMPPSTLEAVALFPTDDYCRAP